MTSRRNGCRGSGIVVHAATLALHGPRVAFALQGVHHLHALCGVHAVRDETHRRIGFVLAERNTSHLHLHLPHVEARHFGQVIHQGGLHRLLGLDILSAAEQRQQRDGHRNDTEGHPQIIERPAPSWEASPARGATASGRGEPVASGGYLPKFTSFAKHLRTGGDLPGK